MPPNEPPIAEIEITVATALRGKYSESNASWFAIQQV
jgi:hypothetical protein